jgi:hypothetical protein
VSLSLVVRAVAALGIVFVISGVTLAIYFNFWFDTWAAVEFSPPPGIEVQGDFTEAVIYQSDELRERARRGSRAGRDLVLVGVVLALPSTITLALLGREAAQIARLPRREP